MPYNKEKNIWPEGRVLHQISFRKKKVTFYKLILKIHENRDRLIEISLYPKNEKKSVKTI